MSALQILEMITAPLCTAFVVRELYLLRIQISSFISSFQAQKEQESRQHEADLNLRLNELQKMKFSPVRSLRRVPNE